MISADYREELDTVLAYDWRLDPSLCMADKPNRGPRSSVPKSRVNEDRLDELERGVKATNEAIAALAGNETQKKREQRIREIVRDAVKEETKPLCDAIEKLKPRAWRKALFLLREWSVLTTAIATPLTLLAIVVALGIRVTLDVKEEAAFRTRTDDRLTRTDDRLTRIENRLLQLTAMESPSKALDEIKNLKGKAFTNALPALSLVTEQPILEVKPDDSTLHQIAQKLYSADESVPDYWKTVLRFITFVGSRANPNVPPPGPPTSIFSNNNGFGVHIPPIKNQVVLLDGGDLGPIRFEHCRIIFTKHPVQMNNVDFVDCVFELPDSSSPNEYIKRVTKELLVSNLTKIKSA